MISCSTCQLAYDPDATGGACPRCALAGALGTTGAPAPTDDFEFVAELGRGAMGVVTLARQRSLDRLVALKVIATGPRSPEWLEARLLREARAAAQLQHPHIATVYEAGRDSSGAYLAMEYCEGGDLRTQLREKPLPARAVAQLGVKLASAMAQAHGAGILHRDLKPSNVLLTGMGEPKITDFGLTASISGTGEFTTTGEIAGSPSYLAPETLAADARPTAAVDIYGLGAILYEGITGRPPFTGDNTASVLAQILQAEPAAPRLLNRDIPRDLETIILKCLQKSPAARYASAAALGEDLTRYLEGRPIAARPPSLADRAVRWGRRNPALVAAGAVIVLGTLVAGVLLADRSHRLAVALEQATHERAAARAALGESLLAQARSVRQSGRQGQRYEALRLVREAITAAGPSEAARTEAIAALALEDWEWTGPTRTMPQVGAGERIGFSADLSLFAAPGEEGIELRALSDGTVHRKLAAAGHGALKQVDFGRVPGWVAARYRDYTQGVWGPGDTAPRWVHRPEPAVQNCGLDFAHDGSGWWYTGGNNVVYWHPASGGPDEVWSGPGERVYEIGISPDGRHLAIVRDDQLELWRVAERKRLWVVKGDVGFARPAWTRDGRYVIGERFEGAPEIVVWDLENGAEVVVLHGQTFRSAAFAMLPDGRRLLSVDEDSQLHLWDISAGRELVRGLAGPHALGVSADGGRIVLSSGYQELRELRLAPLDLLAPLQVFFSQQGTWQAAAAGPGGRWFALAKPNRVRFIAEASGAVLGQFFTPSAFPHVLGFVPGDRIVYSSSRIGIRSAQMTWTDGRVTVSGDREVSPPDGFHLLDLSRDGSRWLTSRKNGSDCYFWPEGDVARAVPLGLGDIGRVSPDGRWALLIPPEVDAARLYSLPEAKLQATLPGSGVQGGLFSDDGRWLALFDNRGYHLHAAERPEQAAWTIPVATANPDYLLGAFSPDNAWLACVRKPGEVTLFNLQRGRIETTFVQPGATLMQWSADSQRLFLFSRYNEVAVLRPFEAERLLQEAGITASP